MSDKYEIKSLSSYYELKKKHKDLISALSPLSELDRELTLSEEWAFDRLCEELDDVSFKMKEIIFSLLEETDEILLTATV